MFAFVFLVFGSHFTFAETTRSDCLLDAEDPIVRLRESVSEYIELTHQLFRISRILKRLSNEGPQVIALPSPAFLPLEEQFQNVVRELSRLARKRPNILEFQECLKIRKPYWIDFSTILSPTARENLNTEIDSFRISLEETRRRAEKYQIEPLWPKDREERLLLRGQLLQLIALKDLIFHDFERLRIIQELEWDRLNGASDRD